MDNCDTKRCRQVFTTNQAHKSVFAKHNRELKPTAGPSLPQYKK